MLGSTGSIGTQTLDVARRHPDRLEIVALAAGTRVDELLAQAREFGVCHLAVGDERLAKEPVADDLRVQVGKGSLGFGADAVAALVQLPEADVVVNALVGAAGLRASYETLAAGKVLALANKESLVVGGDLIMPLAAQVDARRRVGCMSPATGPAGALMPIDSEHGAIYQCLLGEDPREVARLWVTASGGPFRGRTRAELADITPAQALAHPTWNMGAKISIDSFGAEWLSDARVVDPYWSAATGDHTGYRLAELDVALALADYLESHELDASNTKLLVCGHSRGGSVANLLARDLLDIAEESAPVVAPENLFAYTFAPSASTREASAGDARYHSIYNVENPTDLVPRVPLAAWGYRCYGTTVSFPGTDDEGFDEAFEAMQEARARNTGFISTQPYRFGEACPAQSVADAIAERVPTVDDLSSLSGAAQATSVLVQQDLYRILASHFPDTYLAWMQSLDPKDLTFEQAERQGGPETRSDD